MIEQNPILKRIIRLAVEEDLAAGDVTTDAMIRPDAVGKATLIAREELILAGMPVFKYVFKMLGPDIRFDDYFKETDLVLAEENVCLITGALSVILKAERTALNFLQRMSGIATLTRQYVKKADSEKVKIVDTRKTVPGHRWLDKYAVRVGGGANHRFNLSDGVLIKDNHIAAAGSIQKAVALAKVNSPHTLKIEVEVEDLEGLREALQAGADIIMLDNMNLKQMTDAVNMAKDRNVLLEASGNITLDTIHDVAKTGVHIISVGALTHSPKAADFSLEIVEA